jgi:predicted MFS family arabinose efflux permease
MSKPGHTTTPDASTWQIVALSVAAFAGAASTRVADPLLPRLDHEFGTGLGTAAQVITAFSVAYGLLQAFYGPVGDRFGKYRVIAWACIASGGTSLLCALAPDFNTLVIARFLAGSTAAAVIPLSMAWIGDVIPYEQRQPVIARFLTGQIFGLAFGQLLGGLAADYWSWRVPFVGLALWFAITGLVLLRMHGSAVVAPMPPRLPGQSVVQRMLADFGYVLRQPWARRILVVVLLEGATMFGAFAFLATHLHLVYGLSLTAAGSCLMLYAAGGLTFAALSPMLVRRLGEVGLASGGGAMLCVALLMVGLAPNWPLALVGCYLAGLGFYMLHNTLQLNATQMAPERRGAAVAMFASCLFLGSAAGVAIFGIWVERISTVPIISGAGVALLVIGLVFGRMLARRHHRR